MRISNVRTVFWKEVVDSVRDSRTIFLMIALPLVIYPALFTGMGYFEQMVREKQEETAVSVAVVNAEKASGLLAFLKEQGKVDVLSVSGSRGDDPGQMIRQRVARVALVVPDGFETALEGGHVTEVDVLYDGADMNSIGGRDRITSLLAEYGNRVVRQRLESRGLDVSILETVKAKPRNVATAREMGAFAIGTMVPFLLIILMSAGAQHTAIDVTVGEKERSTLETVLVTSASRTEIVLGKFAAVMLFSLATALMGLVGLLFTMYSGLSFMSAIAEGKMSVSAGTVLILLLSLVPVMIFLSAAFMAIGCFAKSIKEGQTYSSYFYMVIMLAAVVTIFPGLEFGLKGYAVPLVGVLFLEKEVLMGSFNILHIAVASLSTLVIAVGAIFLSVRLFSNEKVMFRV
ncbi:MAG: ABC transporter permease [Candidatus Eisenbacteria bacterium]|nr:ABC transporter permease [Candidatus Eisenbacteria bacterium]